MVATSNKQGIFKRTILSWAKGVGLNGNLSRMIGGSVPMGWRLASSLVFKKVRAAMGLDRCKICMTAAAPIMKETLEFFTSLDIPIMEIYGLSETSGPHTISTPFKWRLGSVGPTMAGSTVTIAGSDHVEGEGEICLGGRNIFMGYLDDEEKTMETLDSEGLLRTGDIGKVDENGFVYITGRIKELIITAGGENVAPVLIEDAVKEALPCISNCMLVGDRKKFLAILLTLKTEIDSDTGEPLDKMTRSTIDWCKANGSDAQTVSQLLEGGNGPVMDAIQEGINKANKKAISRAQIIQKFSILPRDFTIIGGELGPTLKLRRPIVVKMHESTINAFYSEQD
jgi:long-chain-fatty-acid--CoA ligase ACSBG